MYRQIFCMLNHCDQRRDNRNKFIIVHRVENICADDRSKDSKFESVDFSNLKLLRGLKKYENNKKIVTKFPETD